MSPIKSCPNRACELTPSTSNMVGHPAGAMSGSAPHQRATALGERPERLVLRDGGAHFVIVPGTLRFRRLLDLEQIHRVDLAAVRAHGTLAEQRVVGRHL